MTNFGVYPPSSGREVRAQLKVLIADITLTNSGSFEAIPIPAGFDSLEIVYALRSTAVVTADEGYMLFNLDTTAANYSRQYLIGLVSTVTTVRTDTPQIRTLTGANSIAGDFGIGVITIPFHTQPGMRRIGIAHYGERRDATNQEIGSYSFNWESTEPITSITLRTDNHPTDLFAAGSRVQVFGLGVFAVALAR